MDDKPCSRIPPMSYAVRRLARGLLQMHRNSRKPSRLFRAWRMGARHLVSVRHYCQPLARLSHMGRLHPPFALGVGRAESYLRDLPQAFQPSRSCLAPSRVGDSCGLASNPLATPSLPTLGAWPEAATRKGWLRGKRATLAARDTALAWERARRWERVRDMPS